MELTNILETNDYSLFKTLKNNRDVVQTRVNKIKASFIEGEILNPIIVNEKMEVIDGQGRLAAKRELNRPVQYIVVPGLTIADCQRLNKYTTKWSSMDFIESYAKSGNENYVTLMKTMQDCKMGASRTLRLANHGAQQKGDTLSALERGTIKFTHEDYEKVMFVCNYAKCVIEALADNQRQNDAFYVGISIILNTKGFDKNRFLENCKKCRGQYVQASSLENQLKEYSRIYNFKKTAINRVYFEDYMRNKGWNARNY